MNTVALRPNAPGLPWHQDKPMLALVRRTTCKDCTDDEFSEFIAVCRDLNLSPLRRQIYCFVFSKNDADKRNMSLVVGIDGARSIAARSGNYQPDDGKPEWVIDEKLVNPLTNPNGIESCTVGVYHRPTKNDQFRRITHTVFWEEFAPIVSKGDPDAYEWVGTGKFHPEGHKRAGQEINRRQLKAGASANIVPRLDPDKAQWSRQGRNMIAKCAEMGALRKGWPEDLSRVVAEEETHRSSVVDLGADEYANLTPAEMAAQGDADARLARLGGPALFASFDDAGTLERVEIGKFADTVLAHTEGMAPERVALFVERNRVALQELWAHNKTDALELKKVLEKRSGVAGGTAPADDTRAKAAPPKHGEPDNGGAASPAKPKALTKLDGTLAERHRDNLMRQISQLDSMGDLAAFSRDAETEIGRLPDEMADAVRASFNSRQHTVKGMQR